MYVHNYVKDILQDRNLILKAELFEKLGRYILELVHTIFPKNST